MSNPIIDIRNISKVYKMGSQLVHALRDVSVSIHKNEYVALMGPSGSGKSTMMNILGCLDTPSSGTYFFNGTNVRELNDNELAEIRNREIGKSNCASIARPSYELPSKSSISKFGRQDETGDEL